MSAKPNISVFFPAYNEQENIKALVKRTDEVMKEAANNYEIIIVDDGSTDKTAEIIKGLADGNKNIRIVTHPVNKGYGAALKSGIYASKYELIFYTDSDMQFDIREIKRLLPLISKADIVSAYRVKRKDPFMRKLTAWAYNLIVKYYLGLKLRDIDSAFKLYKREIFGTFTINSTDITVDAEILAKAKNKGFKIAQIGVNHYKREKGVSVFSKNHLKKLSYYLKILAAIKEIKKEISE